MNLLEYQGLELFRKWKIPHPKAVLLAPSNRNQWKLLLKEIPGRKIVLKAQIPAGKRGKSGGILIVPPALALSSVQELLSKKIRNEKVQMVLAEEFIDHQDEWYLSIALDRAARALRFMFSEKGGMDIEEIAETSPKQITSVVLQSWNTDTVKKMFPHRTNEMVKIAKKVWDVAHGAEATLVEINPVMVLPKKIVVGDAKVVLDDNALFRHPELQTFISIKGNNREEKARKLGLHYVELDGNIGIVGCGAGMVMATIDLVTYFGGKPANFLDIGGGASKENMTKALEILTSNPKLRGVFINIFGGITKCDEIARGIVDFRKSHKLKHPVVVRMIGTNEKEGQNILEKNSIRSLNTMEEAAEKIVLLVKR